MTYLDREGLPVIFCDACGKEIDRQTEPGRFRHTACPAPVLPDVALSVFAQVDELRNRKTKP